MEPLEFSEFKMSGVRFRSATPNQEKIIRAIRNKDNKYIFIHGPAGTGKTFCAMAEALRTTLSDQKADKWCEGLRFIRPAVGVGREIGFLPGDLNEKIRFFMKPFEITGLKLVGVKKYLDLEKNNISYEIPYYMRGDTFEKEIVILDESQNITKDEMKLILSRIGNNSSRIIIVGDDAQPDIGGKSGFTHAMRVMKRFEGQGIEIVTTTLDDMKRDSIICKMLLVWDDSYPIGKNPWDKNGEKCFNVPPPLTYKDGETFEEDDGGFWDEDLKESK